MTPGRHSKPVFWLSLLLLPALAAPARGQQPATLEPVDAESALVAWLVGEARKGPAGELEPVLLKVENLYTDGAFLAAADLAGAFLRQAETTGLAPGVAGDNLRYLLAGALGAQGATNRARRLLLALLERRPLSAFRLPALRKLVDLTLEHGDFEPTLKALAELPRLPAHDDEITYLKARALLALGHPEQARQALQAIAPASRFKAASLYLQGILALESKNPEQAEAAFCAIVDQPGEGVYTFRLSAHSEQLREQAWLALARLRHDSGAWQRALDSYAQIAPESPLWPLARYEAAWGYYRLGRHQDALATLDAAGLDVHDGANWPDAMLLRGYALLGLCQFEAAEATFRRLQSLLGSPGGKPARGAELPLAGAHPRLLQALPPNGLEKQARRLARATALLQRRLAWLWQRLRRTWSGMPARPLPAPWLRWQRRFAGQQRLVLALQRRLARLSGLAAGAQQAELAALAGQLQKLSGRARRQREWLRAHFLEVGQAVPAAAVFPPAVRRYLELERKQLLELSAATAELSLQAGAARAAAAAGHLSRLAEKLAGWRKQTAIGLVDAVLGRKQSLEIEVENLAQGRYPFSVYQELAASGRLADDVEYWPYDGEGWPDEYEGY